MIQLGRFERLGSGVRNINKYLPLYAKGAKPIFEEKERGFRLTIPIGEEVAPEVTTEVTPEVTPEVKKMLIVIQGEMTRIEIMAALGLKDEKHFREKYQQLGIATNLIEMTIPDKPRSSRQKYRITAKGKQLLGGTKDEQI